MKKHGKASVAALVIAGVLGVTGCSVSTEGSGGGGVPKGGQPKQVELKDKPSGFKDNFPLMGTAPEEWQGTSGWQAITGTTEDHVYAIGDFLAYREGIIYEEGSTSTVTQPGRLVLVDNSGNKVYTAKEQSDLAVTNSSIDIISKDGKPYLVYKESGTRKADPNSLAKDATEKSVSVVTVLDKDGKELYSKQVEGGVSAGAVGPDSITVSGYGGNNSSVMDVVTGEVAPEPFKADHEWLGRYDGVDLFSSVPQNVGPGVSEATVTNGTWSKSVKFGFDLETKTFGTALALGTLGEGSFAVDCSVIDVHTGDKIDVGTVTGCDSQTDYVTSPDRNLVAYNGGIFDLAKKKTFAISDGLSFSPAAITNSGDVYGVGNGKVGFVNVNSSDAPKALPGVDLPPVHVSNSGLAAFTEDDEGTITVFMTKK